jgi:RimJ/RimL family protein N-acetyltransferase
VGTVDDRVRLYLEEALGFSLDAFPSAGAEVRESSARADGRDARLRIVRIGDAALATGIPRVAAAIRPAVECMSIEELFSPLGLAELSRAMQPEDAESLAHGFDYVLTSRTGFRPAETPHEVVPLTKRDIPPEQFELRMSERRESECDDFVWAFARHHDDPEAVATENALFGPRCASIAIVIWHTPQLAGYGLGTDEPFRGRRYALAVVSAATEFILRQGAVAWYQAYTTNIPSLRIPRRLGFRFAWQTIWA